MAELEHRLIPNQESRFRMVNAAKTAEGYRLKSRLREFPIVQKQTDEENKMDISRRRKTIPMIIIKTEASELRPTYTYELIN